MTAVETLKKDVASIDALKDKLSGVTADVKSLRDEVVKLSQEAERNRSTDLERKASHDFRV